MKADVVQKWAKSRSTRLVTYLNPHENVNRRSRMANNKFQEFFYFELMTLILEVFCDPKAEKSAKSTLGEKNWFVFVIPEKFSGKRIFLRLSAGESDRQGLKYRTFNGYLCENISELHFFFNFRFQSLEKKDIKD